MRFLNTKIQETKETPWIRVFHFLGEPAATYHVGGNPAQMAAVYLGHHNPGQPQASARLGPENDTLYVFCCAPASRTLRVLPAQGPERGVSDRKRKRTPCGVLFLLGSGSYLSFLTLVVVREKAKLKIFRHFRGTSRLLWTKYYVIQSCQKVARLY